MEKRNYFKSLNGLRGIFCIIIMLFHTLPLTPLISRIPLSSFITLYGGLIGNYMFFMLSGFLMTYSYRDKIGRHEISAKEFFVKKLCKLYPLYILSNMGMLFCEILTYGLSSFNLQKMIFTILLQSGGGLDMEYPYNGPGWFISALLVCYLLFFFIAYHAKHKTGYYCMITVAIIWGYSIVMNDGPILPIYFAHNGESIMNFFIGCILAEMYPFVDRNIKKWLMPVSVGMLILSAILLMNLGVEIASGNSRVAFAFVICPLILYLALDNQLVKGILQWKPILFLGKISFSIYLWHAVVYRFFLFVYRNILGYWEIREAQYLLYLVIMFSVSILSWRYIENGKSTNNIHNEQIQK